MNIVHSFQELVVRGDHQGMIELLKTTNNPESCLLMNEAGSTGMFPTVMPC